MREAQRRGSAELLSWMLAALSGPIADVRAVPANSLHFAIALTGEYSDAVEGARVLGFHTLIGEVFPQHWPVSESSSSASKPTSLERYFRVFLTQQHSLPGDPLRPGPVFHRLDCGSNTGAFVNRG
jgi:hypothetical protein